MQADHVICNQIAKAGLPIVNERTTDGRTAPARNRGADAPRARPGRDIIASDATGISRFIDPTATAYVHRRQFVRDGEVPVTVVRYDDGGGTNKLDAARQSLREQIVAREQAERMLEEARTTIHGLETQLAHERIAGEEAIRRVEDRGGKLNTSWSRSVPGGRRRRSVISQEAEERLSEVVAAQVARKGAATPGIGRRANKADEVATDGDQDQRSAVSVPVASMGKAMVKGRRGRPPKVRDKGPEFVEWWKPGWRERFR